MKTEIISRKFGLTFTQENDCCEGGDCGQFLEIFIDNGGVGEEGEFFVMKTDRWAFDDIDEVIEILKEFKKQYKKIKQ